ncbi:MAG: shikimate dehydrogenase [Myxococcales bacterium]|nr:shikimate dehydrogenase [Myxococcota bacterium]MDW8281033.1 shikimate dehydrogenase [Myxococcales bacterium]
MVTRLGVLGWPVDHSLSPTMQTAALRALGLHWSYAAFAVPPAELASALSGARALGLRGVNLTLPHKEAALALCEPDDLARRVGAVNTLCFDPDCTRGYNTDVAGFRDLCGAAGVPLRPGLRALVLGAGGAARAVLLVLREAGALTAVHARTPRPLCLDGEPILPAPLSAEALAPLLPTCDLVVDCTPRGLLCDPAHPAAAYPELDAARLPRQAVLLDLAVRPRTALSALAERHGLRASTGGPMLVGQGAAALALWLGSPLPPAVRQAMAAAVRQALAEQG